MIYVYIDHPSSIDSYSFMHGEKTGSDVVSRKTGADAKFICNSLAKISSGDVYKILFDNTEDVIAFILTHEYRIIPNNIVEDYIRKSLK